MCPACGAPLIVFELHGVEVDHCPACGGTWLDAGELDQIAALAGAGPVNIDEGLSRVRAGQRTRRRCPRCRRRLRLFSAGTEAPVELDACPAGHGLWFDKGEMRALIERNGTGVTEAVGRFFEDLFRHEING